MESPGDERGINALIRFAGNRGNQRPGIDNKRRLVRAIVSPLVERERVGSVADATVTPAIPVRSPPGPRS